MAAFGQAHADGLGVAIDTGGGDVVFGEEVQEFAAAAAEIDDVFATGEEGEIGREVGADVLLRAAEAIGEVDKVVGRGGGGGEGLGGEGFLADGAEFGVDEPLVFEAELGDVGPEAGLDFVIRAGDEVFKVAVLAVDDVLEVGFELGGAVLIGAVEIGDAAEELDLVDAELLLPVLTPLLPVMTDIGEVGGLLLRLGAEGGEVRLDGFGGGETIVGGGEAGFERVYAAGVLFKGGGNLLEGAVGFFERFEGRLGRVEGAAVELDLFADVPIEDAGDEPFPGLDERVFEARWTGVDGADGGDLGFGGVAGVEEGEQVGESDGKAAAFALGMAGGDALTDFADGLFERVLSVHACSS